MYLINKQHNRSSSSLKSKPRACILQRKELQPPHSDEHHKSANPRYNNPLNELFFEKHELRFQYVVLKKGWKQYIRVRQIKKCPLHHARPRANYSSLLY